MSFAAIVFLIFMAPIIKEFWDSLLEESEDSKDFFISQEAEEEYKLTHPDK